MAGIRAGSTRSQMTPNRYCGAETSTYGRIAPCQPIVCAATENPSASNLSASPAAAQRDGFRRRSGGHASYFDELTPGRVPLRIEHVPHEYC